MPYKRRSLIIVSYTINKLDVLEEQITTHHIRHFLYLFQCENDLTFYQPDRSRSFFEDGATVSFGRTTNFYDHI